MNALTTNNEQQAIDFLTATNTEFSVKYLRSGKHFEDDKESRDIYEITLKRGGRAYTFEFGQSINDSGFYYTMGVQKIPMDRALIGKPNLAAYIRQKINFAFLNNGKSDKIHYPQAPNSYDVLACLTTSDPGIFENFCSDFGYDTDSRKAEKTYKAVSNEWLNICKLFTDQEIEQLQEIN